MVAQAEVLPHSPDLTDAVAAAESLYRSRRRRARFFPEAKDIFGEPAFDILLDLFVRGERDEKVSVSSASVAADAPTTTALRWIERLVELGLVEKSRDERDARRSFLRLTGSGRSQMLAYLGVG